MASPGSIAPRILVVGREAAERAVRSGTRVDALISVRDGPAVDTPDHSFAQNHPRSLLLAFDDVSSDWGDLLAPKQEQVAMALRFGATVLPAETLMVHCAAGVSRSAGLALGILTERLQNVPAAVAALDTAVEHTHSLGFRARARDHHPNAKVILHCDRILGLRGTLIDGYCNRFGVLKTQFWRFVDEEPE